jgi:hypothetical protein
MASVFASFVFALAWVRPPLTASTFGSAAGTFVLVGIPLLLLTLVIGLPLALLIERCRLGRWWSYTLIAAATGALIASGFGRHSAGGEVSNPHGGIVLSPWTRDRLIIDEFPRSSFEYVSTIVFCAVVGGVLGLTFWYLHQRGVRPNNRLERSREG